MRLEPGTEGSVVRFRQPFFPHAHPAHARQEVAQAEQRRRPVAQEDAHQVGLGARDLGKREGDRRGGPPVLLHPGILLRGLSHSLGEHDSLDAGGGLALREQAALRAARPVHRRQPPGLRRAGALRHRRLRLAPAVRPAVGPHADARQAARRAPRRHALHARCKALRERDRAAAGIRRFVGGRGS